MLSSVISTCAVLMAIIGIICLVKIRNKRLRREGLEERVRLLNERDAEFQFLVFLVFQSFSSEDDMFVQRHVLEPLKVCFKPESFTSDTGINFRKYQG